MQIFQNKKKSERKKSEANYNTEKTGSFLILVELGKIKLNWATASFLVFCSTSVSEANYNIEKTGSFLASGRARKNKAKLGNSKLFCFLFHFSIDCDFLQADP